MPATQAMEIGSSNTVECSRRILSAMGGSGSRTLKQELAHAARVCEAPLPGYSALEEEQAELLGAIVERMRLSTAEYDPYTGTEVYLLGHLAKTQ